MRASLGQRRSAWLTTKAPSTPFIASSTLASSKRGNLGTGIITTVVLLVIGYTIVSRVLGFAFRLAVPLILIVFVAGTGVISDLIPEHAPDPYVDARDIPDGAVQHRARNDIGDLRLRDLADVAMQAARTVLQGALAMLNGISEPERDFKHYRSPEPRHSRPGDDQEPPLDEGRDWRRVDPPDRW